MIIGVAGKARSGKDTFAEHMKLKYDYTQLAFADPLKEACAKVIDVPVENFYDADKKEIVDDFWGISPREMAQKFGTESMRHVFFDDFWIRLMEKQLNKYNDVVISDVRFENEASWIREQGGIVVHIQRNSLGEGVVRQHASENGIDVHSKDIIFCNDSSIDDFRTNIELVLTLNKIVLV